MRNEHRYPLLRGRGQGRSYGGMGGTSPHKYSVPPRCPTQKKIMHIYFYLLISRVCSYFAPPQKSWCILKICFKICWLIWLFLCLFKWLFLPPPPTKVVFFFLFFLLVSLFRRKKRTFFFRWGLFFLGGGGGRGGDLAAQHVSAPYENPRPLGQCPLTGKHPSYATGRGGGGGTGIHCYCYLIHWRIILQIRNSPM